MQFEQILQAAVRGGASDIVLKANAVPRFRFNGQLVPLSNGQVLQADTLDAWIKQVRSTKAHSDAHELESDYAFQSKDGHRFRVNIFQQRQSAAMVLRVVLGHIRTIEELHLPAILNDVTRLKRGLVLVTGSTGSGKSTTLAALLDRINRDQASHIVTIEDPIEYIFRDANSSFEQREVGVDTKSFTSALRAAMRQNPDVIMVGELRDKATIETALMAAETGHLVMTTLHTSDASESLHRILSYFEVHAHQTVRLILSQVLRAVVSQRLIPRADGNGMVAACEIMMANSSVRDLLAKGQDFDAIKQLIKSGQVTYGMQSFDQALLQLYQTGVITQEQALKESSSRIDMELMVQGIGNRI
jgi:twitching motility protein PilT